MQADEYRRMFELESHYWWFVARRRLALKLLKKGLRQKDSPTVLDLGCGTGAVLQELTAFSNPVGVDMSPLALDFCRTRNLTNLIVGRGESLPFRTASVDAVLALDVLEHIEQHEVAFGEASRVLKPGGVLVLSVPAFKSLWGPHDVALMHFRRYRRSEVRQRLIQAGLKVEKLSYAIFALFPIVATIRFFEKRRRRGEPKASLPSLPGWANRGLIHLQGFEASLVSATSLPWGSSVVALARKPL
jgi:SAM-dependent methyltransferase